MTQLTKTELETLNISYLGQPFVHVPSSINTESDTVYLGQPFSTTVVTFDETAFFLVF